MLDHEPDTDTSTTQTQPAAPRRRRAASRPAGPPVATETLAAAEAPAVEAVSTQREQASEVLPAGSATEVPEVQPTLATPTAEEATAEPATARRRRKTATASAGTIGDAAAGSDQEAPRKRAPRKRTPKTPEPESPASQESGAAAAVTQPELVTAEAVPAAAADIAPPADATPAPAEAALTEPADALDKEPLEAPDQEPPAVVLGGGEGPIAGPNSEMPTEALNDDSVTAGQDEDQDEAAEAVEADARSEDAEAGAQSEQTDADAQSEDAEAGDDDEESGEGGRRRRRRRGGRRRRRSGADSAEDAESDADQTEGEPQEAPVAAEGSGTDDATGDSDAEEGTGRRRRRRRRRGEEAAALPDDPTDVVVRVREPRTRKRSSSTEVTGIEGSTRMEAKRQRRREGRDAGRRRVPILSEAEFLARRESVLRQMIVRQSDDLAQIAVLEDGILVEHYVDRDSAASLIGNVYLGRVQNVLPSMEAAFVDIGRGRNAVLYAGEVDWDSFGAEGQQRKVERVLKSGQMILVQVTKDPVGAKGARLTNHVSIPGRYIVYAPGGHLSGISRKLPDVERRRLKDILAELVGESASVIVRTAAEGASEEELVRDVNRLKAQWADIERKVKAGNAPQLLYGEPDLTVRIVRDLFTEDFAELVIQGNGSMNDAYDAVEAYVTHVAPHLQERIRRWEPNGSEDLFSEYRLDEQIAKALERKVFLPSGGSLVIDRTEAMTVIDVNTGKFTGTGGNLEATVTSNNLEAAEEIVRQLRLRDVGGIIVIDFIDMVLPSNRELLLRRLVECLGRDRTRHQVAEVTSLGLVQMTRKKIGTGLLEAFGSECPECHGRGYLVHEAPVESQQQADGGTREPRSRDHRGRGDQGSRSGNGPRAAHGGRSSRNGSTGPDTSTEAAPPADAAEPADAGPRVEVSTSAEVPAT